MTVKFLYIDPLHPQPLREQQKGQTAFNLGRNGRDRSPPTPKLSRVRPNVMPFVLDRSD
jgi:hypothetical protein